MSQTVIRGPRALSILRSLDAREAGERVLALLVELANLKEVPSSGWLAGQAVATAVEALYLGLQEPRYNDVDHFVADRWVDWEKARLGVGVVHEAVEDYGQMALSSRARYWVRGSEQHDLINRVRVVLVSNQTGIFNGADDHQLAGRELIDGFDFNSVQVGVDLVTRRLFWNREFEEFVQTRQLEVVSMHTPAHTAVRAVKKIDEQPDVWCDLPRVMKSLAGAIELATCREHNGVGVAVWCRTLLGPAIAARARRYESRLSPFFDLVEVERTVQDREGNSTTVSYSTLKPKVLPEDDFMRVASDWPQPLYAQLARLFMRPAKPLRKAKTLALLGSRGEGVREAIGVMGVLCGLEHIIDEAKSPRQIEDALWFMKSHRRLDTWFLAVARSWGELLSTIQWIKRLAKSEGLAAIGVLETAMVPRMSDVQAYADRMRIMQETYADRREEIRSIPSRMPDICDGAVRGVFVRQLLTVWALLMEGSQMRHCAGGYTQSLSDPRVVLLSLRGDPDNKATWSTAEVHFHRRFAVSVAQHRGRFNAAPPPANAEALNEVCQQLLKARTSKVTGIPSLALARFLDRLDQSLSRARKRLPNAFNRRRGRLVVARSHGEEIPW